MTTCLSSSTKCQSVKCLHSLAFSALTSSLSEPSSESSLACLVEALSVNSFPLSSGPSLCLNGTCFKFYNRPCVLIVSHLSFGTSLCVNN